MTVIEEDYFINWENVLSRLKDLSNSAQARKIFNYNWSISEGGKKVLKTFTIVVHGNSIKMHFKALLHLIQEAGLTSIIDLSMEEVK